MIALCVDSNSQLPAELAERFGIAVVPLTVSVDGREYREGVDLDADTFYAAWSGGHAPEVATSQPSPGDFAAVYRRLADEGATAILSVHITAAMSGTLNSARLAAEQSPVPVRLVDTGTASFGISCCAWAAGEVLAGGGDIDEAAAVAEARGAQLGTAFVVGVPALTVRSGRADGAGVEASAAKGLPVLSMEAGKLNVLDTVTTQEDAVAAMVAYALGWTPSSPDGLRVAVGTSDASSDATGQALVDALTGHPAVFEVVRYRIGPSVGAHTGPGTAGLFVF